MESIRPLEIQSNTFSIAYTDVASASVAVGNKKFVNIRLYNSGDVDVFVSVGDGTQQATVPTSTPAKTCIPLAAGGTEIFMLPKSIATEISAITTAGNTGMLYVTIGEGI